MSVHVEEGLNVLSFIQQSITKKKYETINHIWTCKMLYDLKSQNMVSKCTLTV